MRLILGVAAAAAALAAIPFLMPAAAPKPASSAPDPSSFITDGIVTYADAAPSLEAYVREHGGEAAREAFLALGGTLQASQAHILAHAFGAGLYKAVGASGIDYCGSEYSYGCFHQLAGLAMSEHGLGVVAELSDACAKIGAEAGNCLHGIGHGVVGHVGYSFDNLTTSLEICAPLGRGGSTPLEMLNNACANGAFMEYNLHELDSLGSGDYLSPRPFGDDKSDPCFSPALDAKYSLACVWELPDWWTTEMMGAASGEPFDFSAIGDECMRLAEKHPLAPRVCFQGFGSYVAEASNFEPERTRHLCELATTDEAMRLVCESASVLYSTHQGQEGAGNTCEALGLTGEKLAFCAKFISGSRAAATQVPLPL